MKLISESEKIELAQYLNDVYDTFKTDVLYFVERDILTISTDTNFNYVYGTEQNGVTTTTQVHSGIFDATIKYLNAADSRQSYKNFPVENLNIDNTKTYIRIRTKLANLSLVQGIKQLKLDGLVYQLVSAPKPHSLFPTTTKYVDLIFESVK